VKSFPRFPRFSRQPILSRDRLLSARLTGKPLVVHELAKLADKNHMQLSAIALRGLDQAQARLNQATVDLSAIGTDSREMQVDTVDLSTAAVNLLSARNEFALNLKVLRLADDMQKRTIELFG
jgi:hypothetical protein